MVYRTPAGIAKRKHNSTLHKRAIKLKFIEYKGGKCQICGLVDNPAVYDFHHTDPSKKEFKLSNQPFNDKSRKELDKCIMVCANCHRKIHTKEMI